MGGHACDGQEGEANNIGWARVGRWLRRQMRSGADGCPHGALKRAMDEEVGNNFEREMWET